MSSRRGAVGSPAALGGRDGAPARAVTGALRWLAAHQRAAAALLFGLFVLAYLWPVLLAGDVLSPRSVLFQYPPWAAGAPAGWERTTNFILGDVPMSHYPFHQLVRDLLHSGTFPAWSQHAYGGVPLFANPQTLILSPFALPIWILPLELGIGVSAALKLWMAAFGTYLLVRELRLGFWPGVLAGISFALSAWSVLWLTHETLLAVAAMLPWSLWLVERALHAERPLGPALGLALVGVLIFTGGHPGAQVHVTVAIGIYALIRAANVPELLRRERLRRFAFVLGGVALGALLCAVLLVPAVRAGADTIGIQARTGFNASIPGAELPFGAIRTALFPDWWGRPSALSLAGPANYNERTFYAGAVATILALIALASPGAWRRKAPFAVLGGIGLAVPLHAPGLFWLATNLPLLRQVQFQRMLLLFVFAAAVLGAFGLQHLLDAPRQRARTWIVLGACALIGLLALATSPVSGQDVGEAAGNLVRLRHAIGGLLPGSDANAGGLVATSVGWWLVVVALVAGALAAWWRRPRRLQLLAIALVAIAAVDVLYFARDYQPMAPAHAITPPRTPAIAYLQEHRDAGRVTGLNAALQNDWDALYGLRDVRGSEPPQPTTRWFDLWQTLVNPEQPGWSQALMPSIDAAGLNALAILGGRYVVTPPDVEVPSALARQLVVGYRGDDAAVLVNRGALPRALVAPKVVLTPGEQETIAAIGDPSFAPRDEVVVEQGEPYAAALAASSGAGGRVSVIDEANTSVTLRATLRAPGLVVLDDTLEQGWSVEVDGRSAPVVRADSVLRGVAVNAGTHTIVWRYAVPGLRLGLLLSAVGVLVLLAGFALLLRERRRLLPLPH